jgi:PST family polysaccharide transporter
MAHKTHIMHKLIQVKRPYPEQWTRPYFVQKPDVSLSARAANSTIWSFSQKFVVRGLNLISTAIIARILFPEDFGLVGMAVLVMGVVGLFKNYGFGSAIIYKKTADQIDLSTAFWVNVFVGIVLFIICNLAAPVGEQYFKNEQIGPIISLLSFNFLIASLGTINNTILTKEIRFKELAYMRATSACLQSVVTLFLVIAFGVEYWGIVFGMMSFSFCETCLGFLFTRWHPSLVFDIERLRDLFSYGKNLFLQHILNHFSQNIDYFVIGRMLGSASLGIYQFAYLVPHSILTEFSFTITRVLFPLFCKIEDDRQRFERGYLTAIKFISMISFPAMLGLFCVADHFIYVVFGEKYIAAIIPLKILCFSGMAKSILHTMGVVFNSKGRPDLGLKWNLCAFPVIAIAVILGSYNGLSGVALAITLTSYLSFIGAWISLRLAKIRFFSYLKSLLPAFSGSLIMLMVLVPFNNFIFTQLRYSHLLSLLLSILVGVCAYGAYFLLFYRKDIFELIKFIKSGVNPRWASA